MAYKKPQIVAKSAAQQSMVAGCPVNKPANGGNCSNLNTRCMCGALK